MQKCRLFPPSAGFRTCALKLPAYLHVFYQVPLAGRKYMRICRLLTRKHRVAKPMYAERMLSLSTHRHPHAAATHLRPCTAVHAQPPYNPCTVIHDRRPRIAIHGRYPCTAAHAPLPTTTDLAPPPPPKHTNFRKKIPSNAASVRGDFRFNLAYAYVPRIFFRFNTAAFGGP